MVCDLPVFRLPAVIFGTLQSSDNIFFKLLNEFGINRESFYHARERVDTETSAIFMTPFKVLFFHCC